MELITLIFDRLFKPDIAQLLECKDITRLIKALNHKDMTIRGEAAKALGELGPEAEAAVSSLVEYLASDDQRERRNAAVALGKIGKDSQIVISGLVSLLEDNSKSVRKEAVQALARLGKVGVTALTNFNITDPDDRIKRATVLGEIGHYEMAIEDIDQFIKAKGGEENMPTQQCRFLVLRGSLKREAGDTSSAIKDISKAIAQYSKEKQKLDREAPHPYKGSLIGTRGYEPARRVVRYLNAQPKLKSLRRLKSQAYFERGLCYLWLGETKKGRQDLNKAVKLEPRWRKQVDKALSNV